MPGIAGVLARPQRPLVPAAEVRVMGRPFTSVLIANRGEIAVRIIKACRAAKLRAIAVYSDADANALHVRRADEAHRLGPPPAAESYLNVGAILEAARASGAEAIHPGYGFLAENADFAEQVQQSGLVWIGPPPSAMRLLGDKAAAKALAERVGVPTLPGYHGEAQAAATLAAEAERIGFPLLVKAAAGGGRGMRIVRAADELPDALASARREARAGFGDDRLLLERYLERPRHVEMQVFGDERGNVLYLGERDCSIQRRHQKVIEEAPAPNFTEEQRRAMGEASVALARAAGYTNAGTCEFLLDEDGRFSFLEMNTRLQVEHPVTEMVTGLDLVKLQFTVATGEPLPVAQEDVQIRGHAVECRLYAEDPSRGFLPSTGRLERFLMPVDEDDDDIKLVRVDTGFEPGDAVSAHYDSLLAKIVSYESDRDPALDQMANVLSLTAVSGVRTNLALLRSVIASPFFGAGAVHTGFLEEHGTAGPSDDLLSAAVFYLLTQADLPGRLLPPWERSAPNVWRQVGPWRVAWTGAEVALRYDDRVITIAFEPSLDPAGTWQFAVGGRVFERYVTRDNALGPLTEVIVQHDEGTRSFQVHPRPGGIWASCGREQAELELVSRLGSDGEVVASDLTTTHDVVRSPMPGRIVKVAVSEGQHVTMNQSLVVLEAMKIEHLVAAPRDGVVEAVRCKEGDQVELGAELVELEGE